MNQDILMLQLRYATEHHRCTFFLQRFVVPLLEWVRRKLVPTFFVAAGFESKRTTSATYIHPMQYKPETRTI